MCLCLDENSGNVYSRINYLKFYFRKRYEKVEKEFVEVKMDLYRKMERKDLLIEYLYIIIRENELRKVKKFEEFMVKFNVGNDVGFLV